jgi:hypothetical protein
MINLLLVVGLVLFVLWVFGFITSYTLGGYIHFVFVIAVILIVVWLVMNLLKRRR